MMYDVMWGEMGKLVQSLGLGSWGEECWSVGRLAAQKSIARRKGTVLDCSGIIGGWVFLIFLNN